MPCIPTLKENNMQVYEEIMPLSAQLIANKTSYKFKENDIRDVLSKLKEAIKQ